jgi:uncharacterized protein
LALIPFAKTTAVLSNSVPDDLIAAIALGHPVSTSDITCLGNDINSWVGSNGRTALTAAAFAGRCELIVDLVRNGAFVDATAPDGGNALHEAAAQDHADAVKTLLDLGADIEAETAEGNTALEIAAAWDNADTVRVLIAAGANLYHRDRRGATAIDISEEKGREAVVAILRVARVAEEERANTGRPQGSTSRNQPGD